MRAHQRLRKWRVAAGLTQQEAAERAGLWQSAWSLIEHGQRSPSLEQAFRIAEVTGDEVPAAVWLKRRPKVLAPQTVPEPESAPVLDPDASGPHAPVTDEPGTDAA